MARAMSKQKKRAQASRRRRTSPPRPTRKGQETLLVTSMLVRPEPFSEYEAVVVLNKAGDVVGQRVGYRPVNVRTLRHALDAQIRRGGLPRALEVDSDALESLCAKAYPEITLTRVTDDPRVAELTLSREMFGNDPATDEDRAMASALCTISHGYEVMKSAERIAELAPWEVTTDSEPIHISSDTVELTHDTFIVLGNADGMKGIMGFCSWDDWRTSALSAMKDSEARPTTAELGVFYYGSDEVEPARIEAFKEMGYAGTELFPLATALEPGATEALPVVSRPDAQTLAVALEVLAEFFAADFVNCQPYSTPSEYQYECGLGGQMTVRYAGHIDAETGEQFRPESGDDQTAKELFDYPRIPWVEMMPGDFLNAAFETAHGRAPHHDEAYNADEKYATIVIRSSVVDARKGKDLALPIDGVVHAQASSGAGGIAFLTDGLPYARTHIPEERLGLLESGPGSAVERGFVVLLLAGGGTKQQTGVVKSSSAVFVTQLAYALHRIEEQQAYDAVFGEPPVGWEPGSDMAETLQAFVRPLLGGAPESVPHAVQSALYRTGAIAWNLAVAETHGIDDAVLEELHNTLKSGGASSVHAIVEPLIYRWRALFSEDRRWFGDVRTSEQEDGQLRLNVDWTDLPEL